MVIPRTFVASHELHGCRTVATSASPRDCGLPRPRFRGRNRCAPLAAALLALLLLLGACGGADSDTADDLDDPDATGLELIERYAELTVAKDVDGLEDFISDAFIIQRADGSFRGKDDYLANLPDLTEYTISEVSAAQDGNALTVRWFISVHSVVDGVQTSTEPAPRLSTFIYDDDDWRLSSHANFNAPTEEGG